MREILEENLMKKLARLGLVLALLAVA